MSIQYKVEENLLTTPPSWRPRFLPRNVAGTADMAERMAAALPNYSVEEFRTFIDLHNQLISESLSNGEQVTEENAVTYSLSFTGRLDSPDDPLPDINDCLQVRIHASPPFIDNIRQAAKTERLPMHKKTPLISTARDTVLDLSDVLVSAGADDSRIAVNGHRDAEVVAICSVTGQQFLYLFYVKCMGRACGCHEQCKQKYIRPQLYFHLFLLSGCCGRA
jgi:hypothetical protein